ncbi:M50 family metallopeptidase [Staphylococcus simulans]|uniref:M50 family metallopeptidase n=1 Tax=Staphylococcus simulans TaxID=1286 RepID=UPI000D02BE9F|nr:M50 family metallopeptidase [Staphylococcus simulans]
MQLIKDILSTSMTLHLYWVVLIAIAYIVTHQKRHSSSFAMLDIILNYIPVLTHEFGHILFNKISGGHTEDLVIVTSRRERIETSRQGFAITRARHKSTMIITTLGGYMMPPIMLAVGLFAGYYHYPSLFVLSYTALFIYFVIITSRKGIPILLTLLLALMIYGLIQNGQPEFIVIVLSIVYHFILGVLFGEVLQSTWTIAILTFARHIDWDGLALRRLTGIPVFVFSLLWIAFNIYIVYSIVNILIFQN